MRRRRLNQVRAFVGGYFWLPCPNCHKDFGGHEWRNVDGHYALVGGMGICPDCTKAGVGDRALIRQAEAEGQPDWIIAPIRERLHNDSDSVTADHVRQMRESDRKMQAVHQRLLNNDSDSRNDG